MEQSMECCALCRVMPEVHNNQKTSGRLRWSPPQKCNGRDGARVFGAAKHFPLPPFGPFIVRRSLIWKCWKGWMEGRRRSSNNLPPSSLSATYQGKTWWSKERRICDGLYFTGSLFWQTCILRRDEMYETFNMASFSTCLAVQKNITSDFVKF